MAFRVLVVFAVVAILNKKKVLPMIKPKTDWDDAHINVVSKRTRKQVVAGEVGSGFQDGLSARSFPESTFVSESIAHLPLDLFGLGWTNIPAFPISLEETAEAVGRLLIRSFQIKQAVQGLTNPYTIGEYAGVGRDFLYGRTSTTRLVTSLKTLSSLIDDSSASWTILSLIKDAIVRGVEDVASSISPQPPSPFVEQYLEDPKQWSMSWTTFPEVYQKGFPKLEEWASSLTNADEASKQFWPMIAQHGFAFNLIILQKVGPAQIGDLQTTFGEAWTAVLTTAFQAGLLYAIDLRRFEGLKPQVVNGTVRFTPASLVLLIQDPASKAMTPVAIRISGHNGSGVQIYSRASGTTDSSWIYALLAAKASVTVYGVWLGHVYHWHIVTAAMQMTMYNHLPPSNPVYQILAPQSNYLIGFDNSLMLLWSSVAPPTSIASPLQFLDLIDQFANGRNFFDDDPKNTIQALGLDSAAFTITKPWDQYPIVGHFLDIWDAVESYVRAVILQSYADDAAVLGDDALQAWINNSSDENGGNIRGLPIMDSRDALIRVVTSLIYRVSVHGASRLNETANPALTFIANFPPCLQDSSIPHPNQTLDTKALFRYLPKTGTIGQMMNFYFVFGCSVPYEPFIPLEGIESTLFYGDNPLDPRNQALIKLRNQVLGFLLELNNGLPQRYQWPLNIET